MANGLFQNIRVEKSTRLQWGKGEIRQKKSESSSSPILTWCIKWNQTWTLCMPHCKTDMESAGHTEQQCNLCLRKSRTLDCCLCLTLAHNACKHAHHHIMNKKVYKVRTGYRFMSTHANNTLQAVWNGDGILQRLMSVSFQYTYAI